MFYSNGVRSDAKLKGYIANMNTWLHIYKEEEKKHYRTTKSYIEILFLFFILSKLAYGRPDEK